MDETLKTEIINSIIKGNLTQTAASKLYKVPQPQISLILKTSGYFSKVDEVSGNLIYFKKENDINDKLSNIEENIEEILLKLVKLQDPLKTNITENNQLKLKELYNRSMYEFANKNLNTKCERRTFRIPKCVLDQLDDYLLDNPEKYSVFITSAILLAMQNSNNLNKNNL